MASLNKVFLVGNLTKDPEIRYTPSGTAVGDLRVAVTSKFKEREENLFIDVTVWDRQAETCGEYLKKGSSLIVEGRLKLDEWEKDGQKHSRIGIVANRIQFLGGRATSSERSGRDEGATGQEVRSGGPVMEADVGDTGDDDNLPF